MRSRERVSVTAKNKNKMKHTITVPKAKTAVRGVGYQDPCRPTRVVLFCLVFFTHKSDFSGPW